MSKDDMENDGSNLIEEVQEKGVPDPERHQLEPETELDEYKLYQNYGDQVSGSEAVKSSAIPNIVEGSGFGESSAAGNIRHGVTSQYTSWCSDNRAPLSESQIKDIFEHLGRIFGFQKDSVANMFDYFMVLLDSRSSRSSCSTALLSLHSDYIAGDQSNYKRWYFAAQYELDENLKIKGKQYSQRWSSWKNITQLKEKRGAPYTLDDIVDPNSLLALEYKWKKKWQDFTYVDYVYQIGLYLLIWGEANNIRFMPECICFIFKCALDHFWEAGSLAENRPEYFYLDKVITPIYNYIRNQQYTLEDGVWSKRKKDHSEIIGYDDVNSFFWHPESLTKLRVSKGMKLFDLPPKDRFFMLSSIDWSKFFSKTYREKRTWMHLLTNFSRVWVIHLTMYWYYTSFNSPSLYTKDYVQLLDNQPAPQIQWSVVALGGSIACLTSLSATILEWSFVPRKFSGAHSLSARFFLLLCLLIINLSPSVYIFAFIGWGVYSKHGRIAGIVQFCISIVTFLYLAVTPPRDLFSFLIKNHPSTIKSNIFTSSVSRLPLKSRFFSILLWTCVFSAKFFESYVFLTLSLRDPIRELTSMDMTRCKGDVLFGDLLCRHQPIFTLCLLYMTDLVLFFLDTYLWYILCNCLFSVGLSFSSGISIFSPWRNIFARLPERIYTKIINAKESDLDTTSLTYQVWNSIVLSMYREHLLSTDQVSKLIYQTSGSDDQLGYGKSIVRPPLFFVFQDDNNLYQMDDFFTPNKDAERRILFFAQSLSSPIPEPTPIQALPSFSVLIPHYSEKILLNLTEILRENKQSKLSLLEYLKKLHPTEWEAFVKDTKVLTLVSSQQPESESPEYVYSEDKAIESSNAANSTKGFLKSQLDDLPYYCVGFKDSQPEYTLRSRIWCSLRYQTLYRTVSGFMNYDRALRLLYKLEDSDIGLKYPYSPGQVESELNFFVNRKFKLIVAMQKLQSLSKQDKEDAKLLFATFPNLQIVYLETAEEDGQTTYYSTLLDVSQTDREGEYLKKFRIRLSGNPILGDGKSDNQNHAIIFTRGEYLQVIDANQDNYIEECLKIKSILSEFEEMELDPTTDYIPGVLESSKSSPVAFLGAREYIFSESIGILGDIAAGKEQTFGTLFARTLAAIGGKLHYGHPDFINSIYMNTRGGISKAQKGLHLNEDIYAGMNAISRGGRIKHCDYFQCGKGRDLGFGTILNFTTKIGAGMGEQILSREHYYLGTSLPIDRFLSFYYAHAGFHVNNLFIILSVQLFMIVLVNLGSLNYETITCKYSPDAPFTDLREPLGCYNLQPVVDWVNRFVLSVFICFFISFSPLIIQELIEKGFMKALLRILYHFISMAPFFEVFVCQIYAKSLADNISFGGAKYVATGRGFATSRLPFTDLYSRYVSQSIYSGAKMFLIIVFATLTMWQPSLLWFWVTFISMCLAPFIFNPHQFEFGEFFLDYKNFIRWLSRGNSKWHKNSWVGFMKIQRSKYTGYKKKLAAPEKGRTVLDYQKPPSKITSLGGLIFLPMSISVCYLVPYMFINSQTGVNSPQTSNPLVRVIVIACLPIVCNCVVLMLLYIFSCVIGPILSCAFKKTPAIIAGMAHFIAVAIQLVAIELTFFVHTFDLARSLCGIIFILSFQQLMLQFVLLICLSKEMREDLSNRAWWSGKWMTKKLGWLAFTQPFRELIVKVCEMNLFAYDFILGHFLFMIMSPIVFLPFIDKLHTSMVFWLKPSKHFRGPILSKKQRRKKTWEVVRYFTLFCLMQGFLLCIILIPILVGNLVEPNFIQDIPKPLQEFIQPRFQNNNDTGENAPAYIMRAKPEISTYMTID